MEDILLKTIPITDKVHLHLFESKMQDGGAYISIKHSIKVRDMPGEVIIEPGCVPNLVKALTEASMELERRALYFAGFEDGQN